MSSLSFVLPHLGQSNTVQYWVNTVSIQFGIWDSWCPLHVGCSTRWGLQQRDINTSVFYTRLTCVHVEPAHNTPSTALSLPCESHPLQRFSITLVGQPCGKEPHPVGRYPSYLSKSCPLACEDLIARQIRQPNNH